MKNYVKPALSLSLVAAFAFGLTACSTSSDPAPVPDSTATATATPTTSANPTSTPSASPSVVDPKELPTEMSDGPSELEQAREAFADIEVEDGVDKDQAQLALFGAARYMETMYNSGYLANGAWVENGADSQELVDLYGNLWSEDYRMKLETLIDDFNNEDKEISEKAANELIMYFFFFDNSEGFNLPDDCNIKKTDAPSCLAGSQLYTPSDYTYQAGPNGKFFVNATFTANVRFIKDGVQGISPVQYTVQLEMIKNPYPDEENLRYAYIVNDLGGSWKIDNWYEGEYKGE